MEIDEQGAAPVALLSRTQAQQRCKAEDLDLLLPGDILPCRVTHLELSLIHISSFKLCSTASESATAQPIASSSCSLVI